MLSSYITVVGNMVAKPKVEFTAGVPRCAFRVAVGERRFDKPTNTWIDVSTTFFSITAWRDMAEHVAQSFEKGDRVIVAGRFHSREWTKEERSGTALEIDADVIGPDVRWRAVSVKRTERGQSDQDDSSETSEPTSTTSTESGDGVDPWTTPVSGVNPLTGEIVEPDQVVAEAAHSAA